MELKKRALTKLHIVSDKKYDIALYGAEQNGKNNIVLRKGEVIKKNNLLILLFIILFFKVFATFGYASGVTIPTPLAEYRFDETSWNGATGEVKDSSGNGHNGTAHNGATTVPFLSNNSKILGAGEFKYSSAQYVSLDGFPIITGSWTIMAWMKIGDPNAGNGERIFVNDNGGSPGSYGLSYNDNNGASMRFYTRILPSGAITLDSNRLSPSKWYFVSGVLNKDTGHMHLYIYNSDGSLFQHVNHVIDVSKITSRTGDAFIGAGKYELYKFDGNIDEVKIFDKALSGEQIEAIAKRESDGKNYDDTIRAGAVHKCFSDNFNRVKLGYKWKAISPTPPYIENNKLLLVPPPTSENGYSHFIATGVALGGSAPSKDNAMKIEFKEESSSSVNTADGFSAVLSDASANSDAGSIGGIGGSVGYAYHNRTPSKGFEGGWLGFSFDEYGNSWNYSEGNKGQGCATRSSENGVLHKNSFTIRGMETNGNRVDGYCFIANSGSNEIDVSKSNYRILIETKNNKTVMTTAQDKHDGNGYSIIPNISSLDVTQSSTPADIRINLAAATGGYISDYSIDDFKISAINCDTLGASAPNNNFDAWDEDSNITKRVIKTKIVKKDFKLNISPLNDDNTDFQDFQGLVCAQIISSDNQKSLSPWVKVVFDTAHPHSNSATFNSKFASKDAKVKIAWKKDAAIEKCPIVDEDNSTISTDNFAIRPLEFSIDTNTTNLYAGVPFRLDINATDNQGSDSLDYNETDGTSYTISKIDSNASCPTGILGNLPSTIEFSDGGVSLSPKYSEVGDVNISIKENLGSEFALVDENDTTKADRLIPELYKIITFNPYRFVIVNYDFIRSPDRNWRYMSDVRDANISLSFNVQSQNADGNVTKKFDNDCYSKDVNVNIDLNSTSDDGNISYYQSINDAFVYAHDKELSNMDFNGTISSRSFTDGNSSKITYALNIYREHNKPKDPLSINALEINTSYPSDVDVINQGLTLDNNNSQFYYGRVQTNDIDTNKHSAVFSQKIEVYSSSANSYIDGFHQDSTNWYQMQKDSSTQMISLLPKQNFSIATTKAGIDNITVTQNTVLGVNSFTITNHWTGSDSAYIHIQSPTYLWYNQYKDYDDGSMSDCSTHPCFRYNYFSGSKTSNLIKSGDFNGTDIGNDYNQSTYIKKGVKVFR